MDTTLQHELDHAKELAIRAGDIILQHYESKPQVSWKAAGDPVTAADRETGDFLISELQRVFPGDGILCEERPDEVGHLGKSRIWMIDPIDGTVEFIAHAGEFAVMLGLAIEGTPRLGVIYQPVRGKLYYGSSGMGSFKEEGGTRRRLQVSLESDPSRMTMAVSRSHRSATVDRIRDVLGLANEVSSGSLGLKAGLICEGLAHIYTHTEGRTCQWDTCAPQAILHEAGGRMTDLFNAPLVYSSPELRNLHGVIASNGVLHDRIVEVVRNVLGDESVSART